MSTEYIENTVLTKNKIDSLRGIVESVKDSMNTHIGNNGSIHPIATTSNNGFMSAEQYNQVNTTIPALLEQLRNLIVTYKLPSGTTVWYYGDPVNLPEDWEIITEESSSPLKSAAMQVDGGALQNVVSLSSTIGEVYTISGDKSTNSLVKTMALYLIRKK